MGPRFLEKIITLVFDSIAFNVAFFFTFWFRYHSNFFPESFNPNADPFAYTQISVILTCVWILLFFFTGLYRDWYKESRIDEFLVVSRTALFGLFLLFLVTSADQILLFVQSGSPSVLFTRTKMALLCTYGISMLFFATVNRITVHTIIVWLLKKGIGTNRVLVIGANESGMELVNDMEQYPYVGNKVVGFIDNDGRKKGTTCAGFPVFGTYADLPTVLEREKITGIIISHVSASPNEIMRIVDYCNDSRVVIHMVPSLLDVISGHLKTHQIYGVPLLVLLQEHMPPWEAQIKRIVDIGVSLFVLTFGAPVGLLFALLIRLTSPGPAVFKQERIGQNGKPFIMYKFRSMRQDAEKKAGPQWATKNDPRVTPIGRFIRKTRVDEFPQFWNVLKGEMSLVGPRPERAFFIEQLRKEIPWYIRRLKMKPGITGWAQVKHKYDASIEDVKQKVLYDLYYFENMSILLDLKIILHTLKVVFTGKGAH